VGSTVKKDGFFSGFFRGGGGDWFAGGGGHVTWLLVCDLGGKLEKFVGQGGGSWGWEEWSRLLTALSGKKINKSEKGGWWLKKVFCVCVFLLAGGGTEVIATAHGGDSHGGANLRPANIFIFLN
jgi:hypothetical protein